MRHLTRTALIGMLMLAAPTAADASPFSPPGARIYCVPGSTNQCFGAAFLSSGEYLELWIQNVQGSFSPDPTPFEIGSFALSRMNAVNSDGELLDYIDPTVGGFDPYGNVRYPGSFVWDYGNPAAETHVNYNGVGSGLIGIVGCADPGAVSDPGARAQHCPRRGIDGWHRLAFAAPVVYSTLGLPVTPFDGSPGRTSRPGTWDDLRFTMNDGFDAAGSRCTIAGSADGYAAPEVACVEYFYAITTVTPEPATLALLLPGVMGVLVATRRKRAGAGRA